LLLAYQGFEQGVATFYDLPGNSSSVEESGLFQHVIANCTLP